MRLNAIFSVVVLYVAKVVKNMHIYLIIGFAWEERGGGDYVRWVLSEFIWLRFSTSISVKWKWTVFEGPQHILWRIQNTW